MERNVFTLTAFILWWRFHYKEENMMEIGLIPSNKHTTTINECATETKNKTLLYFPPTFAK